MALTAFGATATAQISQDLGVTIGGGQPYVLVVHPGYIRIQYGTLFNAGSTAWVDIAPYGISQYALSTTFRGAPSAITVALQCSTDGTTVGSTIATSTAVTADTQTGTASCKFVRVTTSSITGSSAIDIVVTGASPVAGSAVTVTGSVDTELPAAVLYANNLAYPTSPIINVALLCDDGATLDKCPLSTGGAGAVDANTARTITATDSLDVVSLALIDDTIFADEAAFTYATSKLQVFGAVAESTIDALADGAVGAPIMTLNRQLRTVNNGFATGGATPISRISDSSAADDEDEHAVCTGPCTLYWIYAANHTAASAFLRCENDTAGNTTPGSETNADGEPDLEIPAATTGAGFVFNSNIGASFATALTCWIVSDEALSGTTDVAANDVRVWYGRVQ